MRWGGAVIRHSLQEINCGLLYYKTLSVREYTIRYPVIRCLFVDTLPHHRRKTFSMGEAADKRFYMEARQIV